MSHEPDYSILDKREILQFVFYPQGYWTPAPPGSSDHLVLVARDVFISCRFYPAGEGAPCILLFHGNGEVACDHDWIAWVYCRQGISLFVADYRGYGLSDSSPTFSSMIKDAHPIFNFVLKTVRPVGHSNRLFIMGRSLGSLSALELASHYPQHLSGLIVESGVATIARLSSLLGPSVDVEQVKDLEQAALARIRAITLPVLIIHGEYDTLIPPSEATKLFETVGSGVKRLVIIPGVGHNDIMVLGLVQYFSALREFVFPAPSP